MSGPTAQTQAMRAWVLEHLPRLVPGLNVDTVQAVLIAADAWQGRSLRELHGHLHTHPTALTHTHNNPPVALTRLTHVLHEAGCDDVLLPACANCAAVTLELLPSPRGRVCVRCTPRRQPRLCARCGRVGEITARRPEGGICNRCYRVDPQVVKACGRCGRTRMPAGRLDDGTVLCVTCWPRPVRACVYCGPLGPSQGTQDGPSCIACYQRHRQPRRICGICGQPGRIARRATGDAPDLCCRCYRRPTVDAACSICERERVHPAGQRNHRLPGLQAPAETRLCRCGRAQVIARRSGLLCVL